MKILERLAAWLAPEMAAKAERHDWMLVDIDNARHWLSEACFEEVRLLTLWLVRRDRWRRGENISANGNDADRPPLDISSFRDWLRRRVGRKS